LPGFELVGKEEQEAVNDVFENGGVLFGHSFDGMRKDGRFRVREFEALFAEYMGAQHGLALASGTAALKVGLKALGVGRGDEVITQAFTFVATVEAILDTGAKPVIVNCDDTLNMDPLELEKAITPNTKVILPVHMLGVCGEMDRILASAVKRGIRVLEDNAESPGGTFNGRYFGVLGDAGVFSFDFGKMLTTGEGGMLLTNDAEIDTLGREYQDHGHMNNPDYPRGRDTHRITGFNYRMGELQAAIGMAQLRKLEYVIAQNRKHFSIIREGLKGVQGVQLRRAPDGCRSLCDAVIFEVPSRETADRFAAALGEAQIGTKNLPDAMEWHFAGYWDHMCPGLGIAKDELWASLLPTYERLSRCIALPVMVEYVPGGLAEIADHVNRIAREVV
jgi:8-amino-3,8-dideoxy-alpha-D-manno-octulosonate transaminase